MIAGGRERRGRNADRAAAFASADLTAELAADRARALAAMPVSRETTACLDRFVAILLAWQSRINLIAPSTVPVLWTRHVADSLQLVPLAPAARIWADLGSGGGFPGLVIACALAGVPGAQVHLVESNGKKAAFLREAARAADAVATIHATRIEDFIANASAPIQAVTARALAPLNELLGLAYPLLKTGAVGIFPKGQDVDAELTEAARYWKIDASQVKSRTDTKARIVVVHGLEQRAPTRGKGS